MIKNLLHINIIALLGGTKAVFSKTELVGRVISPKMHDLGQVT